MKVIILSSLAADTGCAVRAEYIADHLEVARLKVQFVKPFYKSLPLKLDLFATLPWYLFKVLLSSADVIMTVKSYPNAGLPILIKKLLGAKVVDTDDLSFAYTKGFLSFLSQISQELFLPIADLHTYHNPKLLKYLTGRHIPREKTYQLKQGVDLKIFNSKKLGRVKKGLLVFVGHFDAACDLEYILKAMVRVFKASPQARLLLIGGGPRKKEYQDLAKKLKIFKKTSWQELVPKEKIADHLLSAEACLLYYKDTKANCYRSSMKLREYLSLGKKVVCNNVGELKDFEKYTYQSSSKVSDFAKMIIKVLSGFGDRRELKGKFFVKRNYSWQKIGLNFAKRLKNV